MLTRLFKLITIALLILFAFNACDESQPEQTNANEYVYQIFKEWYLWYDQIPEVDPKDYDDVVQFVEAIKFAEVDRWSFTTSYSELMAYYQDAEYTGFGAGFIYDYDGLLKITHVYSNSPMGHAGVERGWSLTKLNDVVYSDYDAVNNELANKNTIDFEFKDRSGETKTISLTKDVVVINSVLHASIIDYDAHKVGYLVFDSFIDTSEYELNQAFADFKTQNITDLVVDLRYNGGGNVSTALTLTALIGGAKVNNLDIAHLIHNDKNSNEDIAYTTPNVENGIDIDKVYFITSGQTASASELVINNLNPFMDVTLVGNTSHGKPVGMYVFRVKEFDLAVLPISFKNTNAEGYGDYYGGFAADIEELDDLSKAWGDVEELRLKAALNDISPNIVAGTDDPLKSMKLQQQIAIEYKGINSLIQAY